MTALVVKLRKKLGITYPIQTFAIGMEGSPDLKAAKKVSAFKWKVLEISICYRCVFISFFIMRCTKIIQAS